MRHLKLLFGLKERVGRGSYICWGMTLMAVKYFGELVFYYLAKSQFLSPIHFLSPLLMTRYPEHPNLPDWFLPGHPNLPDWFLPVVILWSLPFIWIGVGMSIRRAADANLSPWLGLLFFVPVVNYLLILGLALAPTSELDSWRPQRLINTKKVMSPLALTLGLALCGTLLAWFSTNFLRVYATSLFVGSPLILGLVQGYLLNWRKPQGLKSTIGYVSLTILLIHLFLLLFALEGIICLAMSLPISGSLALIGSAFGAQIASYSRPSFVPLSLMLLALPLMPWAETAVRQPHEDMVLSTVEIDASPEKVWPHVLQFPDLPPARDWLFRLGVANPLRSRIDGQGVGAVRHCEFSTGAFVEPITIWDEPHRLAFDVTYQPHPMRELSFYDHVDAPHLNGYFRSVHGEFRLVPTANGKTRLEGRTWYKVDMQPGWYWQIYGRWFIHKIHLRVLAHIKNLSENGRVL